MPLINCTDCGKQVSANAKSCVVCGAPTPRTNRTGWLAVFTFVALAVWIGSDWLFS